MIHMYFAEMYVFVIICIRYDPYVLYRNHTLLYIKVIDLFSLSLSLSSEEFQVVILSVVNTCLSKRGLHIKTLLK